MADVGHSLRFMMRRDLPEVMTIERASFDNPWTEEEMLAAMRAKNMIGVVACDDNRVLGFVVYALFKHHMEILNIAVDPARRRERIGGSLLNRLTERLSEQRRREIRLAVRETNLAAQLFFRANGFRATGILPRHFRNDEDAYQMCYRLSDAPQAFTRMNRITHCQ